MRALSHVEQLRYHTAQNTAPHPTHTHSHLHVCVCMCVCVCVHRIMYDGVSDVCGRYNYVCVYVRVDMHVCVCVCVCVCVNAHTEGLASQQNCENVEWVFPVHDTTGKGLDETLMDQLTKSDPNLCAPGYRAQTAH